MVRVMRKQLVKRSLDMMEDLANAEDSKAYDLFWESFGRQLKLGCIEDQGNKDALAKLLRFGSSQSGMSVLCVCGWGGMVVFLSSQSGVCVLGVCVFCKGCVLVVCIDVCGLCVGRVCCMYVYHPFSLTHSHPPLLIHTHPHSHPPSQVMS